MLCGPTWAATAVSPTVKVDADNVKELIKTLESDTARKEFIGNLKTLVDAQSKAAPEETAVPLTETLGINSQTQAVLDRYRTFLAENNLTSSFVGRLALTGGAVLVAALLVAFTKRASLSLQRRLVNAKQRFAIRHSRFRLYTRTLRYIGYVVILSLLLYSLTTIWDISDFGFLKTETASAIFSSLFGIFLVIVCGTSIWELINGFLDYGVKRASDKKAGRMRTLLPIIKSVLFLIFTVMFTLILLSELGINILPLLAGAGIVGVAVGFGAQTIVKDFLSGFTVIIEDLFHVGDVVGLAGIRGVVEEITLRKVQLRDVNGTVFTIPYSDITVIENLTKDFSYYVFDSSIAYDSDLDKVEEALRVVDAGMRADEAYMNAIIEPLEIIGVERFDPNSIIFRSRVKTMPAQQWTVGREYNRRIKAIFAERGIEIPFPQQVVHNKFPVGIGTDGKPLPEPEKK